jgi:hypothetical protein
MSDWKLDLQQYADKHFNKTGNKTMTNQSNVSTIKDPNTITIGVKVTANGMRITAPKIFAGRRATFTYNKASGKAFIKFDDEGCVFSPSPVSNQAMLSFGYKHLKPHIRKPYVSEFKNMQAMVFGDYLVIENFEFPPKEKSSAPKDEKVSKKMGRANISKVDEIIAVSEITSLVRELNRKGKRLGIEWGVDNGNIVGNVTVKKRI